MVLVCTIGGLSEPGGPCHSVAMMTSYRTPLHLKAFSDAMWAGQSAEIQHPSEKHPASEGWGLEMNAATPSPPRYALLPLSQCPQD